MSRESAAAGAGTAEDMSDFVGEAVSDRLHGEQASRTRALGAAIIIGFGATVLAYRLLRSGSERSEDDGPEETA